MSSMHAFSRPAARRCRMPIRRGITLVEVLVTIGIIGILLAVLLPAVAFTREASRKVSCQNTLRQIGTALHAYEERHRHFPSTGWTFNLLPELGFGELHQRLMHIEDYDDPFLKQYEMRFFLCPSDPAPPRNGTNYAGNYSSNPWTWTNDTDGFFSLRVKPGSRRDSELTVAEITDGLSNTVAISEIIRSLPRRVRTRLAATWELPVPPLADVTWEEFADWCESLPLDPAEYGYKRSYFRGADWAFTFPDAHYNHMLPPNRPNCTPNGTSQRSCFPAGSYHPGGASSLYADGRVVFTSQGIDRMVWQEAGSRRQSGSGSF